MKRYLAREQNGGGLHCALIDGNLGSYFFACAIDDPDPECAAIARKMLAMTPTQRRRIYCARRYPMNPNGFPSAVTG